MLNFAKESGNNEALEVMLINSKKELEEFKIIAQNELKNHQELEKQYVKLKQEYSAIKNKVPIDSVVSNSLTGLDVSKNPQFNEISKEINQMKTTIENQKKLLKQKDDEIQMLSRGVNNNELPELKKQIEEKNLQIRNLEVNLAQSRNKLPVMETLTVETKKEIVKESSITTKPVNATIKPEPVVSTVASSVKPQVSSKLPNKTSAYKNISYYTVRPGDNLNFIAKTVYGSTEYAKLIYDHNQNILKGKNALRVNQQIYLP